MRTWSRQYESELKKKAAGVCTRCSNPRSERSKNLCSRCLDSQVVFNELYRGKTFKDGERAA